MSSGAVTLRDNNGPGVEMANSASQFTMNGGSITGNRSQVSGGGVYVDGSSSTFIMNSGSIAGNRTNDDGGVFLNAAAFTMNGGSIARNMTAATKGKSLFKFDDTGTAVYGGTWGSNAILETGKIIPTRTFPMTVMAMVLWILIRRRIRQGGGRGATTNSTNPIFLFCSWGSWLNS